MITDPQPTPVADQHTQPPARVTAEGNGRGDVARRRPAGYVRYLVAVGVVYVALYGWLLLSTNGLPFVMDNNESFSSLVHASNLAHFGLAGSFGLTDEAYGPNPAAHPYVHTHQGNFPRIFAFLLYILGAHTIQAQIVITTLTIGTLGLFFVYHFFSRQASPLFALVVALIFMTDYVLFAQWQIVTYRVWHAVLLFGALLCVDGFGGRRGRMWFGLTVLTFACLFYFEFIFVSFVALLAGMYAAFRYRRRLKLLLSAWAAMAGGALAGLVILVWQLVAYIGWDGLQHDVFLTYFARNAAGDSSAFVTELHNFYSSHNIVFWYNLVDSTGLRTPRAIVDLLFTWSFQVYTPLLSLVALILVWGWLVARTSQAAERLSRTRGWRQPQLGSNWISVALAGAALALAAYLLSVEVLGTNSYTGAASDAPGLHLSGDPLTTTGALLVAVLAVGVTWLSGGFARKSAAASVLLTAVSSSVIIWYLQQQPGLYNQDWAALWLGQLESMLPSAVARLVVLGAAGVGGALVVGGLTRVLTSSVHRALDGAVVYLVCAAAAYLMTYLLSPGYVYSGYLVRSAPLAVFLTDVVLAFAATVVLGPIARAVECPLRAARVRREPVRAAYSWRAMAVGASGLLGCVAVMLVCGVYWLGIQKAYVSFLPPDHFAFLTQLASSPYAGQGMVVDNYAAPVAVQTGQWAYFDGKIQNGPVTFTNQGYVVERDMDTYLWLADKQTNPDYKKPAYFVCMVDQDLSTLVYQLTNPQPQGFCQKGGRPGRIVGDTDWAPHDEMVAQDSSAWDWWEVIKLDWDYPPYLSALPDSSTNSRVASRIVPDASGFQVQAEFTAQQQDGVPLLPPIVRLYRADDQTCLIGQTTDASSFSFPAQFTGLIRLSVIPRTATQSGREYFSPVTRAARVRFTVADARTGGTQEVWSATLDEAHKAQQLVGTWTPAASVGLTAFRLPDIISGTYQVVEARSLESAEQIAQRAGTWVPGAGTFGVFTDASEDQATDWSAFPCLQANASAAR